MLKAQSWEAGCVKTRGWARSLVAQFLEQTFAAKKLATRIPFEEKEARNVLQALLPEPGVDLSLHSQTKTHLWEVSGFRNPDQFAICASAGQ